MKKRVTHEIPIEAEAPKPGQPGGGAGSAQTPGSEAAAPSGESGGMSEARGGKTEKPAPPAGPREPELREAVEQLQRLQAEFANYRRRVERERLETVEFAQHALVEKLVPVLDDFERALASLDETSSPAAKGLALIRDKLSRILADAGLTRIETKDAMFDPTLHEALTTQPVEPERAEQVLEELVAGYTFRNRLVRPARVCVGVEAPRAGDEPAG